MNSSPPNSLTPHPRLVSIITRLDEDIRNMRGPNTRVVDFVNLSQAYVRRRVSAELVA